MGPHPDNTDPSSDSVILHPIPPVFDKTSRVLVLGSFPSVRSRAAGFFYGHPQNRFWRVLAALYGETVPQTTADKRGMLLRHHVAVWDVIASCAIDGSADSSIRQVTPNDLSMILAAAPIRQIFTNGKTADAYYRRFQQQNTGRTAVCLPSTSPANAAWSLERLIDAWKILRDAECDFFEAAARPPERKQNGF